MSVRSAMRGIAVIGIFVGLSCVAQTAKTTYSSSASSASSVYQRWLTEDVRWIITPDEERQFALLTSDAARDRFVERFWERRDPTPGTPQNEFKEEHYRRIAYSNEHFADSRPGWSTDRGHAYILYGPPKSITDVAGSAHPHPAQIWVYRDRTLTFVDDCDCGIYRAQGGVE